MSRLGNLENTDTLLTLNSPSIKQKITDQSNDVFDKLPKVVQQKAKDEFKKNQDDFASIVTHAYSNSMHNIFVIASILTGFAAVIVFTVNEKPLRSAKPSDTPAEV